MYYLLGVFKANAFPPYLREYANPCADKLALIIHFIKSIKKDIIEDKKDLQISSITKRTLSNWLKRSAPKTYANRDKLTRIFERNIRSCISIIELAL
jgi:hypothetical protein